MTEKKTVLLTDRIPWTTIAMVIIILLCFSSGVYAEIYTEQGKRYYKVFGADFNLRNGGIDDNQALKILRFVRKAYEKDIINDDIVDIWENIDNVYTGGKYHGEIILTVFQTYLNIAFTKYHKEEWRGKSMQYFGKYEVDCKAIDECRDCSRRLYSYTYRYEYRIIPKFPEMDIAGGSRHEGESYFNGLNKAYWHAKEKLPSEDKMISWSVSESCKNIEEMLIHIERTIGSDDGIFLSGKFDATLLKITDQYNLTRDMFGKEIAAKLYQPLFKTLIDYIRSEETKTKLVSKASEFELELNIDGNKKKF